MNKARKIISTIIIILLVTMNFSYLIYAATGSASVGLSSSNVSIGGTVSATVSVKLDVALGASTATVSYNPAVLEYTACSGGTANGGGGTIVVVWDGDGSRQSVSATLSFKAIGNGTSSISISSGDTVDWDGNSVGVSGSSASVTVATASNNNGNNNNNNNTPDTPNDNNPSVNCDLSSLQISPGKLSPKFSAGTTKYSVTVEEDVTKLIVSATASDASAKISVSGNTNLQAGANIVKITVTAKTGEIKQYKITVNRGGEPEDTEEEEQIATVNIGGKMYTFANVEEGLTLPQDYKATQGKYGEFTVLAFESPNKMFKIVCLFDGDETGAQYWYLLDEESGTLLPYIEYLANANRYIILSEYDIATLPEGFSEIKYDIDGESVIAFEKEGEEEFILVYATTVYDEPVYYWYDKIEGTFQRYVERVVEIEVPVEVPLEVEKEENNIPQIKEIIMYVTSGLAILFFVMTIILSVKLSKKESGHIVFDDDSDNID